MTYDSNIHETNHVKGVFKIEIKETFSKMLFVLQY